MSYLYFGSVCLLVKDNLGNQLLEIIKHTCHLHIIQEKKHVITALFTLFTRTQAQKFIGPIIDKSGLRKDKRNPRQVVHGWKVNHRPKQYTNGLLNSFKLFKVQSYNGLKIGVFFELRKSTQSVSGSRVGEGGTREQGGGDGSRKCPLPKMNQLLPCNV